jgi:hypothetical protein
MSAARIALLCCACSEPSPHAPIGNVAEIVAPQPSFDSWHGSASVFPLTNGHARARCDDCHRPARRLDANCTANGICHEGDPHHGMRGSSCIACHVGGTWAVP